MADLSSPAPKMYGSVILSARKWIAGALSIALLCSCVALTVEPRAVVSASGGSPRVTTLKCEDAARLLRDSGEVDATGASAGRPLRVLIWNIHKEGDPGWEHDLSTLAATSDVMLLQETVLQPPLRDILGNAGLSWVMSSSFIFDSTDVGVLTATRTAPIASCTQRAMEPLLRIPKSAVISWLPVTRSGIGGRDAQAGAQERLAIINVHAINFDLFTTTYRAQLEALADALDGHRGPIIFAGDFNTWSDARERIVADLAARLGLTELELAVDQRAVFFGHHLDHIFVRGLRVIDVGAIPVISSDHNPVTATLALP